MGTVVEFEQNPLRARMRNTPKAPVEAGIVLTLRSVPAPATQERKEKAGQSTGVK
jgi:hypothetical protein